MRRHVSFGQPNNFAMATADSIIDQFKSITGGVFLAMIVISSVGLMIGGIGVMNIMLVSVTERTPRDRYQKGTGRASGGHSSPIPDRSRDIDGIGRYSRAVDRLAVNAACKARYAVVRADLGTDRGVWCECGHRSLFWTFPGLESRSS